MHPSIVSVSIIKPSYRPYFSTDRTHPSSIHRLSYHLRLAPPSPPCSPIEGIQSYSPQSLSVVGAFSCRVPPLQISATPFHVIDDDGDDTSHHEPPPSTASPSTASPSAASPSGNPNKRAKPSTPIPPRALPSASLPDGTSIAGTKFD
ncbi:unnamed protein product [Lactuca saligna]|uniref:Uncharacterized protein n=1 Tax=Lactuca saligna TaxID=75948 RepID=A0AA35ZDC7_LACSI|nr:unnamed protein product [Lactuca saligna]